MQPSPWCKFTAMRFIKASYRVASARGPQMPAALAEPSVMTLLPAKPASAVCWVAQASPCMLWQPWISLRVQAQYSAGRQLSTCPLVVGGPQGTLRT